MIEDSRRMVARQNVSGQITFQEMVRPDKSKMIRSQSKIEIASRGMTVECEADSGNESCSGRQSSPTAKIAIVPPADP